MLSYLKKIICRIVVESEIFERKLMEYHKEYFIALTIEAIGDIKNGRFARHYIDDREINEYRKKLYDLISECKDEKLEAKKNRLLNRMGDIERKLDAEVASEKFIANIVQRINNVQLKGEK